MAITGERLREVLRYDPVTGIWTWKKNGRVAGAVDKSVGYIRICVDGVKYWAHRLSWFWMTGEWPKRIDHRDTNGQNNRWSNLRNSTRSQNAANRGAQENNSSGMKGVSFCRSTGKWRADIQVDGRHINLGRRTTPEDAAKLYASAAEKHFGEFARAA